MNEHRMVVEVAGVWERLSCRLAEDFGESGDKAHEDVSGCNERSLLVEV